MMTLADPTGREAPPVDGPVERGVRPRVPDFEYLACLNSYQLGTTRSATLDGNGRPMATKSSCNKRNQLIVGLAVDRRGFDLR